MTEVEDKAIRVISFDGKHEDWPVWEEKFLAKAQRRGFKDVYLGRVTIPKDSDSIDVSTAEGKAKLELKKLNVVAYEELVLSIDASVPSGKVIFHLVKGCKTADYMDGDAKLAWKRLSEKFAPKRAPNKLELKMEFNKCVLKSASEDPDEWITKLESIKTRLQEMKTTISDEDLLIHILNNLPKEYEVQQSKLEDKFGNTTNPLTVEEVRSELNLKFMRMHKSDSTEEEADKALAAVGRKVKTKCTHCGKLGHKSSDCWDLVGKPTKKEGTKNKFTGQCHYCKKTGHKEADCHAKKRDQGKKPADTANVSMEVGRDIVLMANDTRPDSSIWIADSAATSHITNSDYGMYDCKMVNLPVTVGDGSEVTATKIGNLDLQVHYKDGKTAKVTLTGVQYVPKFYIKLFSLTAAMSKGFDISSEGMTMMVKKGNTKISFDQMIKTKSGFVLGVKMSQMVRDGALASLNQGDVVKINDLHCQLGHVSEDATRQTAKFYGWKLQGTMTECAECAIAKSRQQNLNKEKEPKAQTKGERLFIDTSSIKNKSIGGNKFWLLAVDDATDYCWSIFLKSKDEVGVRMIELIKELKDKYQIQVKRIRCDNAGEHKTFEAEAKKERLGLTFEYTARNTPQQNGRVERKFATLFGRVRAMLNGAILPRATRNGLWCECAATATHMENIVVTANKTVPAHTQFFGEESKFARSLHTFGEVGVVNNGEKIQNKLADRGTPCIFVGYAPNHAKHTYRMFNVQTQHVWVSRDVKWMKKAYGDFKKQNKVKDEDAEVAEDEELFDDDDTLPAPAPPTPPVTPPANPPATQVNPRILREMHRLGGWFNPEAEDYVARASQLPNDQLGREIAAVANASLEEATIEHLFAECSDFAFYSAGKHEEPNPKPEPSMEIEEPETFQEAFHCPNPEHRVKWRTAIHKEFRDMFKRTVWQKMLRSQIPKNHQCIKTKWVFTVKRDGTFRARIVACGYSQIPGVDYSENYAPVANDVTMRIMIVAMLVWDLDAMVIDVETAFLYGNLEEEIYMDLPEGMPGTDEECLLLLKSLYGLVQAARQWWKCFVEILKKIGFTGGYADPCLMVHRSEKGFVFVSVYVDDNLCVGHKAALKEFVKLLIENGLNIKVTEGLSDYLSCNIVVSKDRKKAWIGQPHLVKKLEKKFGEMVASMQTYQTPGTPGQHIMKVKEEHKDKAISAEQQLLY